MTCPSCGGDNLDGFIDCAACGQPLNDASLPEPSTAVERSLLMDRVGVLNPKAPVHVSPDTPVRDVLRMLVDRRIGCMIVSDG